MACFGFCIFPRAAWAWNAEGHMIIAQIAYNHLDPQVKAKCDELIGVSLSPYNSNSTSNFVTAAVWADDFKSDLGTGSSHYIDLLFSLDGTPTNGVTLEDTNVVIAIRQDIAILQNPTASQASQATALRYLLHFVGDIQQPLHCSTAVWASKPGGDAGGNGFTFSNSSDWSNLHSLWDYGGGFLPNNISRPLNSSSQASLTSLAASIEADYPYSKSIGSIPDPMVWAVEGETIAQTNCYVGITLGGTLSTAYTNKAQATTRQRMAIGGQRLAKLLNTIFATNAPVVAYAALNNTNFSFSWGSVSGRTYRVQWKQQITDPTWTDLIDIPASNSLSCFSESTTATQRLYRAIVVN